MGQRTDWALSSVLDQHQPDGWDPQAWIDACGQNAAQQYILQLSRQELCALKLLVPEADNQHEALCALLDGWAGAIANDARAQHIAEAATIAFHGAATRRPALAALAHLLQLVYERTQTQLRGAGVEYVQAYRAMWLDAEDMAAVCGDGRPRRTSPLSSWTTSRSHATEFAGMTDPEDDSLEAVILIARIPVDRIAAIPAAGLANPAEREMIILEREDDKFRGEPLLWDDDWR